jgi:hypothetical protein
MYSYDCSLTVTNCTFLENTAVSDGGAMYNYDCELTVTSCILWGDSAANNNEIHNIDLIAVVTYSCLQGGYPGTGNISSDPLFVDAANGDYRLQSGSPCIDTGTSEGAPSTDILGVARPQGAGYDMGAYEYDGKK